MPHIHELIDHTVSVFVVHNDRVLLRKHEKYQKWLAVGGHIELDQDANTAALREVQEEVGLSVALIPPPHFDSAMHYRSNDDYTELVPPFFLNIHRISDVHRHHDLGFVARSKSDEVVPENPTDQWPWLSASEVQRHPEIEARIASYALAALTYAGRDNH